MADNVVSLEFQIAEKAAISALKRMSQETKTFEGKATASFSAVSRTFEVMKGVLIANVLTKGLSMLSSAISNAKEDFIAFTGAVAEVNSILPENGKLTDEIKQKFIEFSSSFGGKPQEQAKAFYQIVSAGITDATQASEVLRVSNIAAVAGLSDMTTAADALTSVMATYGSTGVTATNASDTLFISIREGKTTFSELGANIGKVAPIAASAGVKFDELSGTLAFLTKTGLSTDEAATSLRAVVTSLLKPSVDSEKAFKSLGIAYGETGIKANGLSGILEQVRQKTGGNVDMITKLFPNVRALGGVLAVTKGDFQDYNRILGETANASGATGKAFNEVGNSVENQQKKLLQSIANIPTAFLNYFEKPILSALKAANDFIGGAEGINKFLEQAKRYWIENGETIKAYSAALGIAVVAVSSVIVAYSAYQKVLLIAKAAQLGFNVVLAANPIGLAVVAIAALTYAIGNLIKNYDAVIAQVKLFGASVIDLLINPIEAAAITIAGFIGIFDKDMANALYGQIENLKLYRDELRETGTIEAEEAELKKEREEIKKQDIIAEMDLKEQARQKEIEGNALLNAKNLEQKKKNDAILAKYEAEKTKKKLETDKINADLETGLLQNKEQTVIREKEKSLAYSKYAENENFRFVQENLGKKEAAELAYQVDILNKEGKFVEARQLINDTYNKAQAKHLDDRHKAEEANQKRIEAHKYAGGKAVMAMENFFANEQVRSTLGYNNQLLALQSSKNSKLAAIGKAAALIRIAQETAQGAISAYASLAGIPIVGPVLGSLAASALIAFGIERANEVRSSFQSGGIVQGNSFVGDNLRVGVNSGEMILNKSQQAELFNLAKYGNDNTGNNDNQGLIQSILNQPIVIEIDGIEIARAVRNAGNAGFALQGI